MKKEKTNTKKKKFRLLRVLARILLSFFVLFILLVLFIRSPWGQSIIVDKVVSYISGKTHTKVEIERLFVTFSGNLFADGLYLEDQKGDTLVYSKNLEVDVPLWPIIRGKGVTVNLVDWSGLRAAVTRHDTTAGFNFQFLIDAFANDDTATPDEEGGVPAKFYIRKVYFEDFDLIYKDAVAGIDSRLQLGQLHLRVKEMDINTLRFHLDEVSLENTVLFYDQFKTIPKSEEAEASSPSVLIDHVQLKNIKANYNSVPDGIAAKVSLGGFELRHPKMDLSQNTLEAREISLQDSHILLEMTTSSREGDLTESTEATQGFTWPDLVVAIDRLALQNNHLEYYLNGEVPKEGIFNPNAVALEDFHLVADGLYLKEQAMGLQLKDFRFKEASGLHLREFSFDGEINDTTSDISRLHFLLNENALQGNIKLQYDALNALINSPENSGVNISLQRFEVSLQEIFRFAPHLKSNETLLALSKKKVTGKLTAKGSLSSLEIPEGTIEWGEGTVIHARGTIQNPLDTDELHLDFPIFTIATTRNDLLVFVNEEDTGIVVPEKVSLKSNFKGAFDDFAGKGFIQIPEGQIDFKGSLTNKEVITFNADVQVKKLQLGKLLDNQQLGELNLNLKTSGNGTDVNKLNAVLETTVSSFQINDYAIEDLNFSGEIEQGTGTFASQYKDKNIDLVLEAFVELDSIAPHVVVDLDLKGADLNTLGLTDKNIKSAFVLHVDFKGNADAYELTSKITEGTAVYEGQSYLPGDISIDAFIQKDTTSVEIKNKMFNLELHSNTNPENLGSALQRHFKAYLSDSSIKVADTNVTTETKPVALILRGKLNKAPILSEVFLTSLQDMDTIDIQMDFNEENRKLSATISAPYINYNNTELDSLSLALLSDATDFDFDMGFSGLTSGPVAIGKTSLRGSIVDQKLFLHFSSYHEEEKIVHINSEITRANDSIRLHINPTELILNQKEWNIPESNEIVYTNNHLELTDFRINRNGQLFEISSTLPGMEKEHLGIHFENFRLSDFLNYLNPEETLATGRLNGSIIAEDPFGRPGLLADLQINEFQVMDVSLGNLTLNAKEITEGTYDFNLDLKGGDMDLDLTGDYQADEVAARLNLDLTFNEIKMTALEGFSGGEINEAKGSLSGQIKVNGTITEPHYEGSINFNKVGFKATRLNAGFNLADEKLRVTNEGLFLDNFKITDEKGNDFVVQGKILTESYTNPSFDLQFNANDFSVLNSTRKDNELFYGTAVFDADAKLTGDLELPRLEIKLNLRPATDITYILTDSELEIEERDGVVLFVNREDPDDILTQTREESVTISGFAVKALVSIHENATFNVIIDERRGDNLKIGGEGELNFNIYPNGRTTLSGRYTMSKGHFEMNLYNLVNRRFEISAGSSITWAGDPFDAILDIRAIYRIQTAASSLMSSPAGGPGTGMADNRFRQQLPFLVYLNIGGELTQPKLTFNLDMPEDERGAIGGQIYGRIQQLNRQEEELNKQVFSLLVLNRFFPESGSDGSAGGSLSIARNNLNQALSDQLNMFSEQLLGRTGVELDFGLDSFTDYQGTSPQDRTQLDITARKRLFNDRIIVSVGSEVDIQGSSQDPDERSPVIGNVSIEYLLTEEGRFRLKGFRRNQYENVIDGQLIVSGIALIFTREFNRYKELFEKAAEEIPEEPEEKEDNEE